MGVGDMIDMIVLWSPLKTFQDPYLSQPAITGACIYGSCLRRWFCFYTRVLATSHGCGWKFGAPSHLMADDIFLKWAILGYSGIPWHTLFSDKFKWWKVSESFWNVYGKCMLERRLSWLDGTLGYMHAFWRQHVFLIFCIIWIIMPGWITQVFFSINGPCFTLFHPGFWDI